VSFGVRISSIVFIGVAAAIVYPDKILNWLSDRINFEYSLWHIILVEIIAITVIIRAYIKLILVFSDLSWWLPLFAIGLLSIMRFLQWFIQEIIGI